MKNNYFTIFFILLSVMLCGCQKTGQEFTNAVTGVDAVNKKMQADRDLAIVQAKNLYQQAIIAETDLSNGPCLSNDLITDWVADIVHNPRQSVDDLPENQCSAYLNGEKHHFVELDLAGNVIRIY